MPAKWVEHGKCNQHVSLPSAQQACKNSNVILSDFGALPSGICLTTSQISLEVYEVLLARADEL
jgi:hypothetical protein